MRLAILLGFIFGVTHGTVISESYSANNNENNFSNGKTLLFTDTRLQDGSTISLSTDFTDSKKQESELLRLKDGIETFQMV